MKVTKNSNFSQKLCESGQCINLCDISGNGNLHAILHFLNLDSEISYWRHNLATWCGDSVST